MSAQPVPPAYTGPQVATPPARYSSRPYDPIKANAVEVENVKDRSRREPSVLSGMSMEDMEAAETLNSLHKEFHSPKAQQKPSRHARTGSVYADDQPEPLLSLVTSQYPLAGSVINGSLSVYKTTQSYIPGAEWTERNVGLPLAGTVARISGVEGGLRWALSPRKEKPSYNKMDTVSDIEKGFGETNGLAATRRISDGSSPDSLPAYTPGDQSPPYEVAQLEPRRGPPPGWRHQLVISTSGLGVAMSEESLRSLRYCLSWLKWANGRLDGAILNLKELLQHWRENSMNRAHDPSAATQRDVDGQQAAISAKIEALKVEVLQTLKQVVSVVSTYAGGALPENARHLVHRHLTSLPQRFSIANSHSHPPHGGKPSDDAANNAGRIMVLAQEGLDMMTQVSRVVNDTLTSAENWCQRLGRRRQPNPVDQLPVHEKPGYSQTNGINQEYYALDHDVKMQM